MIFYMPVKVYQQRDCVRSHASEWTALGKKALIVTGKSSAKNGALADVTEALKSTDTSWCLFDETEENPSIEMVMRVRDFGLEEGADFVVGIGGGSPMDAAKAIALMIANPDRGADFLYAKTETKAPALPVVEVPTTCGTGSETTPYAILTIHEKRTKGSLPHRIYPRYALADGKYLLHAPRQMVISTYIDALGHYIESYVNGNATDYSRMICEYGMQLWKKARPLLTSEERTAEDYDSLLLPATMAGMAITHTGTALPHGLSYYLTYENAVPHGQAVGYFLPGYLAQADEETKRRVLDLIGFSDIGQFSAYIHQALGPVRADEDLLRRAVSGMMENEGKLKNTPYSVDKAVLESICDMAK